MTFHSVLVTIDEAFQEYGITPDEIRLLVKKGLLRSHVGQDGTRRFTPKALQSVGKSDPWRSLHAPTGSLSSIELFCGAGGLALGMHNAGINNTMLVDVDRDSVATINRNRLDWNALCRSVADVDLLEHRDRVDIMAGGFPCQAFSYAGDMQGLDDARGTLFWEFARLIGQVRPRLVIGENVRGLITHDSGRTLQTMISILEGLGYRVEYRLLRSQFLDVPQKRERLVIFGLRNDEPGEIIFPIEGETTTSLRACLKNVPDSQYSKYSKERARVMDLVAPGSNWTSLPEHEQIAYLGKSASTPGGKTGTARRLAWDEPSPTLTCSPSQKQTERCHPDETRPLTVREYARVQTFPDTWQFAGGVGSQYRQIGNAVPVNMGFHIGVAARATLGDPVPTA